MANAPLVAHRLTKAQLEGLKATARGEVVLTHTRSLYTITGPVGSNTLWSLLRNELIARGPELHGQIKTPMVLTPNGVIAMSVRGTSRPTNILPQIGLAAPTPSSCHK